LLSENDLSNPEFVHRFFSRTQPSLTIGFSLGADSRYITSYLNNVLKISLDAWKTLTSSKRFASSLNWWESLREQNGCELNSELVVKLYSSVFYRIAGKVNTAGEPIGLFSFLQYIFESLRFSPDNQISQEKFPLSNRSDRIRLQNALLRHYVELGQFDNPSCNWGCCVLVTSYHGDSISQQCSPNSNSKFLSKWSQDRVLRENFYRDVYLIA
jgi:hypothetical protein